MLPEKSPEAVKKYRELAGITQKDAAERFDYAERTWKAKEDSGKDGRGITRGEFELLLLLAGEHPTHRIIQRN